MQYERAEMDKEIVVLGKSNYGQNYCERCTCYTLTAKIVARYYGGSPLASHAEAILLCFSCLRHIVAEISIYVTLQKDRELFDGE